MAKHFITRLGSQNCGCRLCGHSAGPDGYYRHGLVQCDSAAVSVLVASDKRLLRAAKAEGLEVLNPETVQAADIPAFLAAL